MPVVVYRFEGIDASLTLVPLAGRRALDRAGRKVSLEAWQRLSAEARRAVVEAGSAESVDEAHVRRVVDAIPWREHVAWPEPRRDEIPVEVMAACAGEAITIERWQAMRAIDRWSMTSLARRAKRDSLSALGRELGL